MKKLIVILSLFLIGCAGSNILDDNNSEVDLEKVFKLKKDKLDQFSVVKKAKEIEKTDESHLQDSPSQKRENEKEIEEKKTRSTNKSVKKEKKSKSLKKKIQSEEKKVEKKEVKTVTQNPELNKDYPKAFRKYNEKYAKFWRAQKPLLMSGEKFTFDISWTIFRAGTATIELVDDIEVAGEDAFMLQAKLESAEYFENIYKLNNTLSTYIKKENFFPIKYEMKQRESGQIVDDVQLFDEKELKTYFYYKRLKEGKTKEKSEEKYIPRYFTDSFSALYFVRSLPLRVGYKFGFPMVTRTKVWLLKAEVVGVGNIDVMDQKISAYKVKAVTQFPGVLKKRGDILFWFSNDSKKRLLRFEAKVKIGSVKGELIDYHAGNK